MDMLSEYIVTTFSHNLVNVTNTVTVFQDQNHGNSSVRNKSKSKLMISSVSNVVGPTED